MKGLKACSHLMRSPKETRRFESEPIRNAGVPGAYSQIEVADMLGISRTRVQTLERRALRRLMAGIVADADVRAWFPVLVDAAEMHGITTDTWDEMQEDEVDE